MPVDGTLAAFVAMALLMGLRHGFNPDHIALIDNITRFNLRERPRLARRAGFLFTAGHLVVVFGLMLLLMFVLREWQAPAWLELFGAIVSIIFLSAIGVLNLRAAFECKVGGAAVPVGLKSRFVARIARGSSVFGIGMIFAFSFDTVAQAGLLAVAKSSIGAEAPFLAGIAFGAGMFTSTGLTSLWVARLNSGIDERAAAASRIATFAVGAISFGVAALLAGALFAPAVARLIEGYGLWVSAGITGALTVFFYACVCCFRSSKEGDRIV